MQHFNWTSSKIKCYYKHSPGSGFIWYQAAVKTESQVQSEPDKLMLSASDNTNILKYVIATITSPWYDIYCDVSLKRQIKTWENVQCVFVKQQFNSERYKMHPPLFLDY